MEAFCILLFSASLTISMLAQIDDISLPTPYSPPPFPLEVSSCAASPWASVLRYLSYLCGLHTSI